MTTTAIYARVSTSDGRQTAKNQTQALEKFCRTRGWRITHRYVDQESGAKRGRTQLEALLSDAAKGRFQLVCVVNLDRLSREGVAATFQYLRRLKDAGVDFVSMNEEHFRTTGPAGELLIAIAAWIAEQERRRHVERVQAGIERARSEGKQLGRPRREGMTGAGLSEMKRETVIDGRAFHDLTIAELARLTGMSKATVCRRLQEFDRQLKQGPTTHEKTKPTGRSKRR